MRRFAGLISIVALVGVCGEVAADEHAGHHPAADAAAATTKTPSPPEPTPGAGMPVDNAPNAAAPVMETTPTSGAAPSSPPAAGGGMDGMMGGMKANDQPAGCMGGGCGGSSAKTPIYATLMTLPTLTAEKRSEVKALANQQTADGLQLIASGWEFLGRATRDGDNVAMQQAAGVMRQGLDELGAGIAAHRVLAEGKAPRNLALNWFKREMNLSSPVQHDEANALAGVTPFHLFTMALLIVFALIMIAMYFFKMRRAAALFGRIEPAAGAPPGAAPPLKGEPVPQGSGAPPAAKAAAPASAEAPGPAAKSRTPPNPSRASDMRSPRPKATRPLRVALECFPTIGVATHLQPSTRWGRRTASRHCGSRASGTAIANR